MTNIDTVVMFNMSYVIDWNKEILNRNYFIMKYLQKLTDIRHFILMDFLPYNIHTVLKSLWNELYYRMQYQVVLNGLFITSYRIDDRTFLVTAPFYPLFRRRVLNSLKKLFIKLHITNAWSWSYDPLHLEFLDREIFSISVFDAVDDWRYHSRLLKYKSKLENNYKTISKCAYYVFTVSEYLFSLFQKEWGRTHNLFYISNGVELNYSLKVVKPENALKKICYIGTIEKRFDVALLKEILKKHTDKQFTIIGPVWSDMKTIIKKELDQLKHCSFIGRVPYSVARRMLHYYDLAILPHIINEFSYSNDPLKIYEYLASGLPVVTTLKIGDTAINSLLYIANDPDTFNKKIMKALLEDSMSLRIKRIKIVKKHTWENKVKIMLQSFHPYVHQRT